MRYIIIDPEFEALIPPLSEDERNQLEENIVADGCRDPLVVWCVRDNDPDRDMIAVYVLLDGHNRYEICTRLGLEYDVEEIDMPDRYAAMDWIDANQLGRRNLTPDAFKLLLGRRYNRLKKARTDNLKQNRPKAQIEPSGESTAQSLGKEHGVAKNTVKRAGQFAKEVEKTPELKAAIQQGRSVLQVKREIKEKQREKRRQENRQKIESVPEPEKLAGRPELKFSTIVVDPPWDWGDEGDQDQLGRARPDYGTMSIGQLMEMPVGKFADEDCHLYLWITNRSLPKGFALMERWGFRYITAITWVKPHFGMGNYFRGQTEHVLFGVRGSQPLKRKDVGSVFHAPRGPNGHSSKPKEFYDLAESCSPGPYLELFSRSERAGWVMWGEVSPDATD